VDRQASFLLALGLLVAAGAFVGLTGWVWFVRERRLARTHLDRVDDVRETGSDG
jgi:hypothetical protein